MPSGPWPCHPPMRVADIAMSLVFNNVAAALFRLRAFAAPAGDGGGA